MRLIHAGILCAALVSVGCGAATTEVDDGTCHQTYEFGNYGCGDVHGRVLDASSQPIRGAYAAVVSAAAMESSAPFGSFASYAQTDSTGRYSVRVVYYSLPPGGPAGLTAWVRVTVPHCNALIIKDSVFVTAPKADVGQRVAVLELPDIKLTLPTSAQRQAACG